MKVTCIYWPQERERTLFLQAIRVTMGKKDTPKNGPSEKLVHDCLNARHSPIRVLNFAFLIEDIPSNISVHLCRHVHAVPFVSSLRNDRQDRMDGDKAPRDTPVDMILYCNAEELMAIANKRLCNKAAPMTRRVVQMMCLEVLDKMPELAGLLVPMCQYHGGVCHEIDGCGKCTKG
jgi:hypothetical protein